MFNDFHVYLNNNNCLQKYPKNDSSEYTNDIIPPIILDEPNLWEVGVQSCILPFEAYKTAIFNADTYDLMWNITRRHSENEIETTKHLVRIRMDQLLSLGPDSIVKKIINASELATNLKGNFFNQVLNVYAGKIVIVQSFLRDSRKVFKNIINANFIINRNTQSLFGLDKQNYEVLNISAEREEVKVESILGTREAGLDLVPSRHITIYTDLIETNRYGPQNLSILDVLPFGNSQMCERKLNEPVYSRVKKRVINDISVMIHDSRHRKLKNHAESMVLCLHFRQKIKTPYKRSVY